jgi:hypothetical protein
MTTAAPAKKPSVSINSKYADRAEMPTRFSPDNVTEIIANATGIDYGSYNDYVRDIRWSTWGGATATGVGRVSLLAEDESSLSEDESSSPVTVALGGRRRCAGIPVYTTYSLALAPGATAPPGWPAGRDGRFPCVLALPGGYRGERLGPRSNCISGLYAPGNPDEHFLPIAPWHPRPPGDYWFLCKLRFSSWGKARAVGRGSAGLRGHVTRGRYEWPIRIELSKPVWCPRAGDGYSSAITYSALTIRLRGGDLANAGNRRRYGQRVKAHGRRCQFG